MTSTRVFALLTACALGFAARGLVPAAQADVVPEVTCEVFYGKAGPRGRLGVEQGVEAFVEAQLAAGRSEFVAVQVYADGSVVCAYSP